VPKKLVDRFSSHVIIMSEKAPGVHYYYKKGGVRFHLALFSEGHLREK
jgi:hypothetical protein